MGPRMIQFIKQLHLSVLGGMVASALLFIVSIMAGRVLGTVGYGEYSFALAISQLVALCITWSFEVAIVRALAFTRGDANSQTYIVSSALVFLLISIICVNIVSFFLPAYPLKGLIMVFATVLAAKLVFDGIMRGVGFFGYQAVGKILEACTVFIAFMIFLRLGLLSSYIYYLVAVITGSVVLLIWYLIRIRSEISVRTVSPSAFQVLWIYGSRAFVWVALSTFLSFIAKYMIQVDLGYQFLGQFTAYQMTTVTALAFVSGLIANVFFPVAAEEGDTNELWRRMHATTKIAALPLWISGSLVATIAVMFYGSSYYLGWWFGIGMAAIAVAQLLCGMYWWIIASDGVRGIKYMGMHSAMGGVIFIVLLSIFLKAHPLCALLGSYAAASLYTIWSIFRWRVLLKR